MSESRKYRNITIDIARAQRAGGLISDFMLQRIAGGWCILLVEIGKTDSLSVVLREFSDETADNAATFPTADEALTTIYNIGFDVSRNAIGLWRPEPKHMERLQAKTVTALEQAVNTLKKRDRG
ncbi:MULTISPECIES: hypothetical protein [unclassified Burkholderia]|uniref:hypothetical protein n=1 Tax=unclassified Burkholderia TaxID=2613784 RepID=UPI002AAF792D|nr:MULTISPECIES: hypothetical protein [unclassified Burkholderia]